MEQHPVPQQISSYEFRLVGDMTLKQFAQLAAGGILALFFYITPLPGYFKWPLMFISFFGGLALAFLPFEERPLTTWVFAFFKAVYSPTQFVWKKQRQILPIFEEKYNRNVQITRPKSGQTSSPDKLKEYLASLPKNQNTLDAEEEKFLGQIQNLFATVQVNTTRVQSPYRYQPQSPIVHEYPRPEIPRKVGRPPKAEAEKPKAQGVIPQTYTPPIPKIEQVKPRFNPWANAPRYRPTTPSFEPKTRESHAPQAQFASDLPMPMMPEYPNIITGMVTDLRGRIIEGAILEIRDSQGNPVRALRTNRLGQFQIATPLINDTYELEIEKEGYHFETVKVELKGEIIKPVEIVGKEQIH